MTSALLIQSATSALRIFAATCFWLREVEVATLLLSANKNNVTDKLANADLLKVSAFIFFDKTSLQKPYYVMIENISSNKT